VKQNVSPRLFIGVVAAAFLLAAAALWWNYNGPSAQANVGDPTTMKKMPAMAGGPNVEALKEIQDWKKAHPGASTRY